MQAALAERWQGQTRRRRVIYYVKLRDGRIWLMTICGKGMVENIPGHLLRALKDDLVDDQID